MKTVTIEIPDFTYAEAQRIADRMNASSNYMVDARSVIVSAVMELGYAWRPQSGLERVVPRDFASAGQLEREGRN